MEKKMETTGIIRSIMEEHRSYIGIMEKRMETLGPFKGDI